MPEGMMTSTIQNAGQTAKDPARLKRMMSIPGYSAAMGLANKTTTKEEVETFDETVLVHATYEIKDSYTFSEYLTTAKNLVGDEDAVELANEAFKVQDTDIFAEELSSMDIMSRINSHRKAGHAVTEPKYSTKAGKPYHEYVVTDKESGTRRKYIHHGDVSKVENMGAKPKKDEQ